MLKIIHKVFQPRQLKCRYFWPTSSTQNVENQWQLKVPIFKSDDFYYFRLSCNNDFKSQYNCTATIEFKKNNERLIKDFEGYNLNEVFEQIRQYMNHM